MASASPPGAGREARPGAGPGLSLIGAGLLALGLALGGCAAPTGVLAPAPDAPPETTRLDILVATTRERSMDPGVAFSGERGDDSFADFTVSLPPDARREIGQVQWPRSLPPDPAREFATLRVDALGSWKQAEAWLRAHVGKNRRVLVFVHGFNTRFETALFNFAQIFHDSGAEAAPVLFSWPSRGDVFGYVYDRESAAFSRDALETLLGRLAASPHVGEVTVLAHSMGAWLAMESLRQMAIRDRRISAKIDTVILASPDIDVDVFRAQLAGFGPDRPHIAVFLSREDRALRLSRGLGGDVARLGLADPAEKPWIAEKGVEIFDLSGAGGDPLRHSKFAQNPDVVRFLGAELINGDRNPPTGLGERVGEMAQGLGGAAGLALTAPLAIVEPEMRRGYRNRIP
jgi:esterase/lipase superfamily enzyme